MSADPAPADGTTCAVRGPARRAAPFHEFPPRLRNCAYEAPAMADADESRVVVGRRSDGCAADAHFLEARGGLGGLGFVTGHFHFLRLRQR